MVDEHLNQPIKDLANTSFTALQQDFSVAEALTQIRERGGEDQIIYFYVVNSDQRLVGVVPTRRLLTAKLEARLTDIMLDRVMAIPETASVLEVCEMFVLHKYLAFPVVDANRRLAGVVNVSMFTEEVLDVSEKERMEDVFQAIGFRVAEVQNASPAKAFSLRFPWLVATLGGGIGCAVISSFYQTTLATSIVLAFFISLVLGLGESVAAQSVAVTVQALHGRLPNRAWLRRAIGKEFATALMLGGSFGGIVGILAWLWRGNGATAFVIGGSIGLSMVIACLVGVVVPATLHRLKLNPQIAAGPVSLALADVFTLLVYFNLAAYTL